MNCSLNVEFLAGTCFAQACKEANYLCKKVDAAYVKFNFNGVSVSVGQRFNIESENVIQLLCEEMGKDHKYLILNS